ncbi:hypothetical protein BV25DRAFT_10790 [Artomyces pyxidatus]|uniref:Uncharacterized protein n=1 Tax=Artomyces pyxidatus TaxID=48021 RepID=A0ACB8TJD4_9AGAM|nr:hypothetical protein BV25DRAFT_10790 [Artomyces pyxidatus]
MSFPSSTPFPIQTFQSSASGTSPVALRDFLRDAISGHLTDQHSTVNTADFEQWLILLTAISDHLLNSFPPRQGGTWDAIHEKVILVDLSFEVLHLVLEKSTGLFDCASDVAETTLVNVVTLIHILYTRNDPDVSEDNVNGVPTAKRLKARAFSAAAEVFHYLGDAVGVGRKETKPTWELMKAIFLNFVGVAEGSCLSCFRTNL